MLTIDTLGRVIDPGVTLTIKPNIEHGSMSQISGIIIHQTGGPTAQSALDAYSTGGNGAHFLIDKDGTIYQTASVYKVTWHVGKLKIRCLSENSCSTDEAKKLKKMKWSELLKYGKDEERKKKFPERYPSNEDSLGIELVGEATPSKDPNIKGEIYETITEAQNTSLKWLVFELTVSLGLPMSEIYRHPVVSYKNPTEAETAKW
jgi:N-acetyl-anhydromuramyl-L-alanine amidase AmpD